MTIDKHAVLLAFKLHLESELERCKARARDAAEGATHAENRAEGDKDMRATEASYLARGLSERVFLLEQAHLHLQSLSLRDFKKGDAILSSALVCLTDDKTEKWYFIIPVAGGQCVNLNGREIQALTTQSPLGSALLGLTEGDEVEVKTPQGMRHYLIQSVH